MAIESELLLYGKTRSFKKGQQAATIDEARIITKVTWPSQTLDKPTHGNCKVGWWGDSIVHQYEIRR